MQPILAELLRETIGERLILHRSPKEQLASPNALKGKIILCKLTVQRAVDIMEDCLSQEI